jgi:tripartite-type tricarboxylate transporter receptor subunit TctC
LLKSSSGIDVAHVPYSGLAKAMGDLVGGHVGAMFVGLHSITPLANDSQVKILGVAASRRIASAPDLPTISEQGIPGFEVEAWYGLFAPAGTPPDVVSRINQAMNEALRQPEIVAILAKQGLDVVGGAPDTLRDLLASDLAKWLKVIKDAGIAQE